MTMNKTITISREYGSGGLATGMMLAKRLGIPLYDRKMVEMAAAEAGLSANVVDDKEEKYPGAFDYRAYLLNCGRPVADRVFFAQSDVIRKLAGQGPCVIVGRCADYVLRDHHECLNIFIHSPLELRVNRVAGRILKLGAPIALQDALVNVSFLLITVIVNQMGVVASTALGIVEKIVVFAMLPPTAMASAVATMTAQNYGAGLTGRMTGCLKAGIAMSLVFGVSVCAYSQVLPETLTAIFTTDIAVVNMGADYLRGYSLDCILVCFVFCINSHLSGQGNSWFPMLHSMAATFMVRIPLSYLFSHINPSSLLLVGYAPPISTLFSLLICALYLRHNNRKMKARQNWAINTTDATTTFIT